MTPNPGVGSPGLGYGRSPFWSGLAGGIAGGFIGSLLFGGRAYGGPMGYGGGPGILDLLIIGALIYFGYRYFVRRRGVESMYYEENRTDNYSQYGAPYYGDGQQPYMPEPNVVERGLEEIRRFDPSFNTERFLETVEDLFFRIQAAWMNRSLDGIENLLTPEMQEYFRAEFARMEHEHLINRLENIAVRKVEPAEVWQEASRHFITVLFTANLLDYTVDDNTGKLINGDKLNPVKFMEFWTFTRTTGSGLWQLAGINQPGEPSPS
jgi:predicted lipid-binding transport protein (Tim44 family)